ncbi:acyl-CoA dehydrogenase family protein [Variovorax humicola]|uniref:Acyl-CoA dehydrogenase family protein n=1 Tax=Variovorax humicola TaxID=1769758 RepID=A0ABU8VTZ3_9BURK
MNFTLSDEQTMIRDSVRDYFEGAYDFAAHAQRVRQRRGLDPARWQAMAELGWLGLAVPQDAGGLGAGAQEAMLLMEGAGAALCIEPLLATAVLAAPLLAGAVGVAAQVLPAVLAGQQSLALAWAESHHGFDPLAVRTTVQRQAEGGFVLHGHKVLVDNGGDADWIVVPARAMAATNKTGIQAPGDAPQDRLGGISLFLVPGNARGLTRVSVPMVDGAWAADLSLDGVALDAGHLIGAWGQGGAALRAAVYRGLAANCAEALGAIGRAIGQCRSYLHERRQFGQPLANFQALQHRFADLLIAEERARSMTLVAAIRAHEGRFDDPESLRDLSLAKLTVGRAARLVGAQAIQLHGGMGMACEHPVGHCYRKLLACDAAFGTPDEHVALLAQTMAHPMTQPTSAPALEEELTP